MDELHIRSWLDGKNWKSSVMLNGEPLVLGIAMITDEDPDPHGTSVTIALHKLHTDILGKDIRIK